MANKHQLLPCPFCGLTPIPKETVGGYWKLDHRDAYRCPVRGEMSLLKSDVTHATLEELVVWWNTRVN